MLNTIWQVIKRLILGDPVDLSAIQTMNKKKGIRIEDMPPIEIWTF